MCIVCVFERERKRERECNLFILKPLYSENLYCGTNCETRKRGCTNYEGKKVGGTFCRE